jgi:hypothetical protein
MNQTDATLLVDIPNTGYRKGLRCKIKQTQKGGMKGVGSGTTLADDAILIQFRKGGEIWVEPHELAFDQDVAGAAGSSAPSDGEQPLTREAEQRPSSLGDAKDHSVPVSV